MILQTLPPASDPVGIALLLLGIGAAYAGFALYQVLLKLIGFVFGAGAGSLLGLWVFLDQVASGGGIFQPVSHLVTALQNGEFAVPVLIAAVIGGVIGAILVATLEKVLVVVAGFAVTVSVLMPIIGVQEQLLVILGGLGGALLAWKFYVGAIIAATATGGAAAITTVLAPDVGFLGAVFWAVLLSGMAVQTGLVSIGGASKKPLNWIRTGA